MKTHLVWFGAFGLATALGCGGESLNDVGDLDTGGAGEGGDGSGGTGASAATGGGGESGTGANSGGGSGAAGGTGGATGGTAGSGGDAGTNTVAPDIGPCNEGDGCVFEEGTGIRALAADATHLYWVEYGTSDELGNFGNNGRLLSRAFDSSEVTTLATDLAGSLGVAVTSTHVYVYLDRLWHEGGERVALVRVSLEGGEPQTVRIDTSSSRMYGACGTSGKCFTSHEDAGYWSFSDGTYEVTSSSNEPVKIADEPRWPFGVDESYVYYVNGDYGPHDPIELFRIPRAGGDEELVTNAATNGRHALSGEYIYALAGTLLRMPKEGGTWTALALLAANPGYDFSIVGDDFFFDGQPSTSIEWSLMRGSLSEPATLDVLVYLASPPESWVGTPSGAYWTDGSTIYFRAID